MAYNFTNATLLDYKINKNYLGEGLFTLNTTKNISIEGILDNRNNNTSSGVKQNFEKISGFLTGIVNAYDAIIVNGYNLGTGKVNNLSFLEQNPIRIGKYRYDLEIIENSNFSNVQTGDIYGTFISGVNDKILSFDEVLNFNDTDNGDYSYNHDINVQYYDTGSNSDLFTQSKNLASSIYNDTLNIGLIGRFSGFYNILKNKKNYFTETYDIINKKCSFSKKILINKNYNTNYTTTLNHTLSFGNDGKISVTEQGVIKAIDNTLVYTADNYFNTELANSYSRCQNIFNSYTEKYGLGAKDSLYSEPFSLGKTANAFTNSLEYSVSYVNDPNFEGNLINNYNITITKDVQDVGIYSEQGEIIQVGQIGSITGLANIKTKYLAAKTRAVTDYPTYKLKSSSFSAGNLGVDYIYKIVISNQTDPPLTNGTYLRSAGGTTKFIGPARNDGFGPPSYSLYPEIWWNSANGWWALSSFGQVDAEETFISYDLINWESYVYIWNGNAKAYKTTYNNNFSYSIEKTNDGSILEGNPYYKSLSMKIDDQGPSNMYKEYVIANRTPKNVFFVSGNQVEIGNKSIVINGTLNKPSANCWTTPISFPLTDLKSKSVSGIFNLISDEAYIDQVSYDYNSDNSFSFSLSAKYLKKIEGT
jgi:hypothetical protein